METILEFCRNEYFTLGILNLNIIILIIFTTNNILTRKTRKTYKSLIEKLSNKNNIEELLNENLKQIEEIKDENRKIKIYYDNINRELSKTIKKIGIVRYSAFKDMGSDLSFALALLDDRNNGVVLNGIYSIENSNIYAKSVENGESKYTLSEEEKAAINIAMKK